MCALQVRKKIFGWRCEVTTVERPAHLSSYIHFLVSPEICSYSIEHYKPISQTYLERLDISAILQLYILTFNLKTIVLEEMLEPQFNILHTQFIFLVNSRYCTVS